MSHRKQTLRQLAEGGVGGGGDCLQPFSLLRVPVTAAVKLTAGRAPEPDDTQWKMQLGESRLASFWETWRRINRRYTLKPAGSSRSEGLLRP